MSVSSVSIVNFKHIVAGRDCFFAVKVFANNSSEISVCGCSSPQKKKLNFFGRYRVCGIFSRFVDRRRAAFQRNFS